MHSIDFNKMLDYVEGSLSMEETSLVEALIDKNDMDKASIEGIKLIYKNEGLSRKELEFFVKDAIEENWNILDQQANNRYVIFSIMGIAASLLLVLSIYSINAIPIDNPDFVFQIDNYLKGPYELCNGRKIAG